MQKANTVTVNRILHFNDEDIEKMTEEEMNQPCNWGDKCPQEPFGNHVPKCETEMKERNHRQPGQSWRDMALEQEKFNSRPEKYGAHCQDQFAHRYDLEDWTGRSDTDTDTEEEELEEEEDDHK